MVQPRGGTFTPSPAQQTIVTGVNHSPHGSHHSTFSAGASPSTNSPVGSNVTKIVVAQIYLLLSTIKEDKDHTKWDQQAEQLRKLVDEHGMEVFQKYFSRLVVGNAPQIFPGLNRAVANPGNYQILVGEIRKIIRDVDQASKIAESIETANEDMFRDFDLSTFMDHFKLDALEKTILALAFKTGSRTDLKTKADAILSTNYTQFLTSLASKTALEDVTPSFLALIIDRYIQEPPPNFDGQAKADLLMAIKYRYGNNEEESAPPTVVLSALYLVQILNDRHPLISHIRRIGSGFTSDEDTCRSHLRKAGNLLTEDQVASALVYTAISQTPTLSAEILVRSLQHEVPSNFDWQQVITGFDQTGLRVSQKEFLVLYNALRPLAVDGLVDIQQMWGGKWGNSETQLSFISAFASISPDTLDATTIPGLEPSFTLEDFAGLAPEIQERAAYAVRHPLVSIAALAAIFNVALHTTPASETLEAKRLFQEVVVPNLDIFLVSAFGVPKPWPDLANDTLNNLYERFVLKYDPNYNFVLGSIWPKDGNWVAARLVDTHAKQPQELPTILEHAVRHNRLEELISLPGGFALDLACLAHASNHLDLLAWGQKLSRSRPDLYRNIMTFLKIKTQHELDFQRQRQLFSVMLHVKSVSILLHLIEDAMPGTPTPELISIQRVCITAYPRLINYGGEYDDIIDANGAQSNSLPPEANEKMEEHYKRMYSDDLEVKKVVEALQRYKHSREPADQDVFACMIHGLFDEYALYGTYPLEALATTAVLFGAIIHSRLIENIPLEIGLGMILEAVRDHTPDNSMYKFGLQALMQLFARFPEWPAFCRQLLQIPGLQGTEAWNKAEDVVRAQEDEDARIFQNGDITNGNIDEILAGESGAPPFTCLHVDPGHTSLDPDDNTQDRVQFVLNNITKDNLETKFMELKEVINDDNQQWFAGHLVAERAKMQPNYHELYLSLVSLFGQKSMWAVVLRETYICAFRSLNSESTMNSAIERTQLKNLATWLGSLTLARDKPIKYKNISFKQLLIEGFQTQRLIVVIPFVCKVLAQGKFSNVFKPPNPWVMDVIGALMELYHKADLKLNLRFEIEVLCGELALDHKSVEPSDEIMNRLPAPEEATDSILGPNEVVDRFDNISLNGMGGAVGGGRFSPQEITSSIPDLGPLLVYPPANDIVNQTRLQEIVRTAITRAVYEIISPVVERSVTIAAISTAQMIHKDFATEPSEARLRSAAILMVKKTAGSLALVTSKEPLRASMTNYIRALSAELPTGLPEGTIIMCVNSNLDLACSQVEKKAEERAVPEIEDMIEIELENRRVHRMTRPDEPYVDPGLSRWSWTIPNPYKLQPSMTGLNQEQMAIYDDFARHPRLLPSLAGTTHVATPSDARSLANDVLQDQYSTIPTLPTPAEPAALPHLNTQPQAYAQQNSVMANGRAPNISPRGLFSEAQAALEQLERLAAESPEQHYSELPRSHPIIASIDTVFGIFIRLQHGPEGFDMHVVDFVCTILFERPQPDLVIESLVHILETMARIGGRAMQRISAYISHQSGEAFLKVPIVVSLIKADMIDWHRVDAEASKALEQQKEIALQFLSDIFDEVLLSDRPIALFGDFARSLEVAWQVIDEDPSLEIGQQLKQKLAMSGVPQINSRSDDERHVQRQEQMDYVFEEWLRLCNNQNASERSVEQFIQQLFNRQIINNREDLCLFLRLSIDSAVDRFEQHIQNNGTVLDAYMAVDSLAKLISMLVKHRGQDGEVKQDKAAYLKVVLSVIVLVLNHHHVMRGEHFNQKVFFRLFATMLSDFNSFTEDFSDLERQQSTLVFAQIFLDMRPSYFPGFMFGWLGLVSHRNFLPVVMSIPSQLGWAPIAELMDDLLCYLGELLKPLQISTVSKEVYRGVFKFLVVLQHDYPEFLAANHTRFCANIPGHCVQMHNLILASHPAPFKIPDPLQPGLKVDRIEEIRDSPDSTYDVEGPLRRIGLLDVVDQALTSGPSEDAVAHIAHAIQGKKTRQSSAGYVPISADQKLIGSLVIFIGQHSIARATQKGGPVFVSTSPDVALTSMLVHELRPEARYFFLGSIVDQLRFPNTHTHYFTQALLELFGTDHNDQEELDIRQQITRILLERLMTSWSQPWGVIVFVSELLKNEKYGFFDLPFIKQSPDIIERFASLASRPI